MTILAVLLVAMVTAVCAADGAQPAMVGAEGSDGMGRICDTELASGAPIRVPALSASQTLPATTLPVIESPAQPASAPERVTDPSIDVRPARHLVPLPSRPPPATS